MRKRLLILAGPYTGKTTAAKAGKAFDLELDKEGAFAKTSEAYKQARDSGAPERELKKLDDLRRKAYDDQFDEVLKGADQEVIVGHFSPDKFLAGKKAGRDVRLVVLDPDVLRKRIRESKDPDALAISRAGASAEQFASLIHWLNTDGRWQDPPIYKTIDSALQ